MSESGLTGLMDYRIPYPTILKSIQSKFRQIQQNPPNQPNPRSKSQKFNIKPSFSNQQIFKFSN
jgi:hypothetical protein